MTRSTLALAVALAAVGAACKRTAPASRMPVAAAPPSAPAPAEMPAPAPAAMPAPAAEPRLAPGAALLSGKLAEKIDVPPYSYLRITTASGDVWAAVDQTDRKVGDAVAVKDPQPMQHFTSTKLNRTFDLVYFGALAGSVPAEPAAGAAMAQAVPAAGELPPGHPPMGGGTAPQAGAAPGKGSMGGMMTADPHGGAASGPQGVKVKPVARAPGAEGRTVAEVWAQKDALVGKAVVVRGQVVKSTSVMDRVFLHLRDGTGAPGKDEDLTVTTSDPANVGEVVTARGLVSTGKDFGAGYTYPVIVEGAKLTR